MRKTGRISGWCLERGFGFCTSLKTGKEHEKWFDHVSQWRGNENPVIGQRVSFQEDDGVLKGPCRAALNVEPAQ
jgi:cold shock CspA family protein